MIPRHQNRKRGVILSSQGLKRLLKAKTEFESNENLGKRLTRDALGKRIGLDPDTVAKVFDCEVGVDKKTLKLCFTAFDLQLESSDYQPTKPNLLPLGNSAETSTSCASQYLRNFRDPLDCKQISYHLQSKTPSCIDWGEAPDVSLFLGRSEELTTLKQWILDGMFLPQTTSCRVVTLWGPPGIGKTWLSTKLVQEIQDQFEFVIWRSLYPPLPFHQLVNSLISTISRDDKADCPDTLRDKLSYLIHCLQQYRCLIVFDQADFVMRHCTTEQPDCANCAWFPYKADAQAYCELFKRVGEATHQSCVILASREEPEDFRPLEGKTRPVRTLQLSGLPVADVQNLFNIDDAFTGTPEDWHKLVQAYGGNPRALTLIAPTIRSLFASNITAFLEQNTPVFGQVSTLLRQQLHCLPETAESVLHILAQHSAPMSFAELRSHLSDNLSPPNLLEALEVLQGRSLLKIDLGKFSLQPLVLEYLHSYAILKNRKSAPSYSIISEHQLHIVS